MKIVTIGGGSGQFTILSALRNIHNLDIASIVSMADSGGSTGRLRDEYGVLPPGDILKCLVALSPLKEARQILQSRFVKNKILRGHNAGNLLLVFLSQYLSQDFPAAVDALGEILTIQGRVLPVSVDKVTLAVELNNGDFVYGEAEIDVAKNKKRGQIKRIFLVPHAGKLQVYPPVIDVLKQADYIFIGPGDLFTSIMPNLLFKKVSKAIREAKGKIVYLLNIMTKFGETAGFIDADFIQTIENIVDRKVDIVVANNKKINNKVLKKYLVEGAEPVPLTLLNNKNGRQIISTDLLSEGDLARHDIYKLNKVLKAIIN